jgi:hypothetical protein
MSDQLLPPEVGDFLAKHIDSIAQLEALLLLHGSPASRWDAPSLAKRLYIGDQEASAVLSHLDARGLVSRETGAYRFEPRSDDLARATGLLADHYRRHLIQITNMVHAKPSRIRQFADAFKLKKE